MLYFDGWCVLTLEAKGMLDFQCMIARYFKTEGRAQKIIRQFKCEE